MITLKFSTVVRWSTGLFALGLILGLAAPAALADPDDQGSGRIGTFLSFRGSGRVEPTPPTKEA